jgi:hypothetical protein
VVVAANNLGTVKLDASGTASVTTASLGAGAHTIIVTYSGDPSYLNGSGSTSFTVTPEMTATTLSSSAGTTAFGQTLKFTATVSPVAPGIATPVGTVTFFDGSTVLGVANVTATGLATFSTTGLGVGTHTFTASYGGGPNFTSSISDPITQLVQVGTQITISSTANPAFFGQPVVITAKLKALPPGTGMPADGETVNFYDGSTFLITATLTGGTATLSTSSLSIGTHTITVTYAGDAVFLANTGGFSQSVIRANTTTSVHTSLTPSVYGQTVTFTAAVAAKAPGAGTPTGNVKFYNGAVLPANLLGSGTLDGTGTATFSTGSLSALTHTIIAVYQGDTNYATSQANVSQVVSKDSTTTTISSLTNSSVFGQLVTFTATVAPNAPGGGTPSGLVTFLDTSTATPKMLGTATLNGGMANFSISTLAVGSHTVVASYAGDNNFTGSQAAASAGLTVSQDGTTTTVTSSANPSVIGQAVTFTAAVAANAPGGGIPTGTVTFLDGGVPMTGGVAKTLTSGKVTFTTSALAYGTHTITVSYSGSTSYLTSTSLPLAQQVFYADTVTLSASPGTTVVYGQSLTFNATVAAVGTAPAVPSGTVDFFDGATDISGPVSLVQGVNSATASFVVSSPLAAGKHTITVRYSGDVFFIPKVSPTPVTETVNKASTTTTISASDAATVYGLPVTFTAAVGANLPGSGTPTGTVTFWDGPVGTGKNLGSTTLTGGVAQLAVTTLGAAATPVLHNVNVSYAGDTNFQASNDTTPAQVTVTQATTQTTISASLGESSYGQRVTFSALVTPITGGGIPNGTVKFYDGAVAPANLLGSATLDSTGTANFPISSLAVGDHNVLAVYQGNNNYGGSTTVSSAFLTVDQASTSVNLTSSANPSFLAQSVTFTAAVVPVAPGGGTPTGTVTFMDGTTVLGTVKVSGGKALLVTSALALGGHDITASYNGDTNFTGNTSSDLSQTVLQQTVASLSASVSNPSGVGVNTAFSITVTALDANGKQVFADFDAVSIVLLSGPAGGTLTGTLTSSFQNGTITFGGLKVTKASTTTTPYKVQITSGGLTTTLTFVTGGRQT